MIQPNDDTRRVTSQVQEKAEELMERAGETARSRVDDGKQQAARELSSVAQALRNCGSDLEHDRTALLAPYINRAAEQVDRFSHYIDTHTPQDIAHNVESFARRNPAVFLGSCFALGMVAARFLKASRPELPAPYGYQESAREELRRARPMGDDTTYSGPTPGGSAGGYEPGVGRARDV